MPKLFQLFFEIAKKVTFRKKLEGKLFGKKIYEEGYNLLRKAFKMFKLERNLKANFFLEKLQKNILHVFSGRSRGVSNSILEYV
jgi:hypothetical protein